MSFHGRKTYLRTAVLLCIASTVCISSSLSTQASPTPTEVPATPTQSVPPVSQTASTQEVQKAVEKAIAEATEEKPLSTAKAVADTLVLPAEKTDPFTMAAVTWSAKQADAEPVVSVRAQDAQGKWGAWTKLEAEETPDEEKMKLKRAGTQLAYLGNQRVGIEVKIEGVKSEHLTDIKVNLIDSNKMPDAEGRYTLMAPARPEANDNKKIRNVPKPKIITRDQWGATDKYINKDCALTVDPGIQGTVVHHTAGSNDYTQSQVYGILRGVQIYHAATLGWCDIGYNFLIDKFGNIYEGRKGSIDSAIHGAHAGDGNWKTFGVSMMMNSETYAPSAAVYDAAAALIAWKFGKYGLDTTDKATFTISKTKQSLTLNAISGHREISATACPGKNIWANMNNLRNKVQTILNRYPTGSTTPPPVFGDSNGDRLSDIISLTPEGKSMLYAQKSNHKLADKKEIGYGWNFIKWVEKTIDLNGDNKAELIAIDNSNKLRIYWTKSYGFAGEVVGSVPSSYNLFAVINDSDKNGFPEIVARDGNTQNLYRIPMLNKKGKFGTPKLVGTGWKNFRLFATVDDFDQNGSLDLLAFDNNGVMRMYSFTSSGWLKFTKNVGTGWNSMRLITSPGDMDGDGTRDLVAVHSKTGIMYLYGAKKNGWKSRVELSTGWGKQRRVM